LTGHDDHEAQPAAARARRLEEQLITAGLTSDDEIDEFLTGLSGASPVNGARMAARAWTDPRYRDLLLDDGNAAAAELGFGPFSYQLRVIANDEDVHNVIVCTLCSCYPVSLLGPSPGWYKSFAYRSRTVREPRAVLAEFGVSLGVDLGGPLYGAAAAPGRDRRAGRRGPDRAGEQERAHRNGPGLGRPG
jgi:nitrile hydratase